MEAISTYKNSLEECKRVQKKLFTAGSLTIDLDKMDSPTKGAIKDSLSLVLADRIKALESTISTASNQSLQ